mgnify:CR=1 FL=1
MFAHLFASLLKPFPFVPLAMLAVGAVELAIADRKYGLFSGGFGQSSTVDSGGEIALFAIGFVLTHLAAAMLAWRISAWLARHSGERNAMLHFCFLYGGLSLVALTAQYQLHSYFSDAVGFALLTQLGGGSTTDALLFARNEIALGLAGLAVYLLAWWVCIRLANRLLGTDTAPATRPTWRWVGAAWLAFAVALAVLPRFDGDGAKGLGRILVWNGASGVLSTATDFDGDGYGLVGNSIDLHPFDGTRHPLALDIPGNGIDEDGYGGDLALVPVPQPLPGTRVTGERPHVVIVVFESTRADVLGKRIDGELVAPNLAAVVAQGSAVAPAFSHVGFTTSSLKSIFGGALAVGEGAPSLFRDLEASGYRIGVFSGQPEDFGGISEAVGMRESADIFIDAEQMKDQRAFSFAAQGSLLVDESIVLDRFDEHFGRTEDWAEPQFVYLNFQSPHFPYHHPGVPERFAHPPLERGQINAANRAEVERTYWNAVAHADAALGRMIARLKETGAWDDTILLVTGDHGEALFENGFLGHGHVINRLQYATFLASNRRIEGVNAPIALSDYRRIVLEMLGTELPPAPKFAPFMHIGALDHPTAIGTVDADFGVIALRLDRGEACFERGGNCRDYAKLEGKRRDAVEALVARWGSERWAARKREITAPGS